MIFNTHYYWGTPARLLHWIAAAMILFLYFHGLWIEDDGEHGAMAVNSSELFLHAATGATLGLLMLGRYLWRVANKVPMLPAKTPEWEKKLAALAHVGLYVATFVTIIAGWLLAGARNPALEVKILGVVPVPTPSLFASKGGRAVLEEIHELAAHALMLMVVMHILAALWHHYVQKDSVLKRMLLRGRNRTRPGSSST